MAKVRSLQIYQFVSAVTIWLVLSTVSASAQISTEIIEKHRDDLQKQATDPAMKRERGTQPEDWLFNWLTVLRLARSPSIQMARRAMAESSFQKASRREASGL